MFIGILIAAVIVAILTVFQLGGPSLDGFDRMTNTTGGIMACLIVAGLILFVAREWLTDRFIGPLFNWRGRKNLSSRRRIIKSKTVRTAGEARIDAMDDAALEQYLARRGDDAVAVEAWCERLKKAGRIEDYAREREYFLALNTKITLEEKCRLYNELADLYQCELRQPDRARGALTAIVNEFPRSYQATLARGRIEALDQAERCGKPEHS